LTFAVAGCGVRSSLGDGVGGGDPGVCASLSQSCQADGDCCSDSCEAGVCTTAACTVDAGACQSDAECCSDSCVSGTCRSSCGEFGSSCDENGDCCQGLCAGQSCDCIPGNAPCDAA